MCQLRKLDCHVCKTKEVVEDQSDDNNDVLTETYFLRLCEGQQAKFLEMKEIWYKNEWSNRFHKFHCPNIQWPPDLTSSDSGFCEACLCETHREYRNNFKIEQAKEVIINGSHGKRRSRVVREYDPHQWLPDNCKLNLAGHVKDQLLEVFEERIRLPSRIRGRITPEDVQAEHDSSWIQREAEAGYRHLTISIPRCTVCREMKIIPDKSNREEDIIWIADLELEASPTLLKWIFGLIPTSFDIQVELRTNMIIKPCSECVAKEFKLRKEVSAYYELNDSNYIRWMIASWLSSRGMGHIPMFEHSAVNVGFPDTKPPSLREMLCIMSESWKRVTSVGWHDVVDLGTPAACVLPIVPHMKPFVRWQQWPEWTRKVPLSIKDTLPSLKIHTMEKPYWKTQPRDTFLTSESDSLSDDDVGGDEKQDRFQRSAMAIGKLKSNAMYMESLGRKVGLNAPNLNKVLTTISKFLEEADEPALPGAFELQRGPVQLNPLSNAAQGNLVPKSTGKPAAKDNVSEKPGTLLFEVQGACINETTRKAMKRATYLIEEPDESPRKRVRFFEPDGLNAEHDDLYDNDIGEIEEQEVPNGEDETQVQVRDNEAIVKECSLGGFHVLHVGELVSLPFGHYSNHFIELVDPGIAQQSEEKDDCVGSDKPAMSSMDEQSEEESDDGGYDPESVLPARPAEA